MTATLVLTNAGLSWLASAISGASNPPVYLVLEAPIFTFTSTYSSGVSSINVSGQAHLAGDTQLVLGPGLPTEEVVTFSGYAGGVYTLSSPTTQSHTSGDHLCRLPLATDTVATLQSEIQYDPTNDPNQRLQSVSGYASGTNQWTMQFFLTAIEASSYLTLGGISDSPTVGLGNLYAHFVLGVNHVYGSGGTDIEIDLPLTLS